MRPDQLRKMRLLVAKAHELRVDAHELVAALERNAAQLAQVRNDLLEAALDAGELERTAER